MSAPWAALAALAALALVAGVFAVFWAILAFCDDMLARWREER